MKNQTRIKNSDDYDKKYVKIRFDSDDKFDKSIEVPIMTIVVRAVLHEIFFRWMSV